MKNKIFLVNLIFVLMILTAGCTSKSEFSERIPKVRKSQFAELPEDWRNLRYGEIIPIFKSGINLYVEVYNSVGSNELPQDLWLKLNAGAIAKEYGAEKVILNGPRYWLVNKMESRGETLNGKVVNFGGIEMTQRATLNSNIFSGTVGSKIYSENAVERETTFHYWKDNMVYELISPEGEIYRMQSYAQFIDPTLSIENLENLGEKLALPEGWTYRSRILNENSDMVADGVAYVINDNLGNSYQKIIK